MERQIVDIEYEDGSQHIGQIYKDLGNHFSVNFLGYAGDGLWDFDGDHDLVPRESISGFYDATRLQDTGLYEITKMDIMWKLIHLTMNMYYHLILIRIRIRVPMLA